MVPKSLIAERMSRLSGGSLTLLSRLSGGPLTRPCRLSGGPLTRLSRRLLQQRQLTGSALVVSPPVLTALKNGDPVVALGKNPKMFTSLSGQVPTQNLWEDFEK